MALKFHQSTLECIKKEGFMRILPGVIADGGNDGFFISILEKK